MQCFEQELRNAAANVMYGARSHSATGTMPTSKEARSFGTEYVLLVATYQACETPTRAARAIVTDRADLEPRLNKTDAAS